MWKYLNKPQDFKGDWYGELTNQCAHTLLGMGITCTISTIYFAAAGEFLPRWLLFAIVSLSYGIIIEWLVQEWEPGDSWFDWLMVSFGSAFLVWPLEEYEVQNSGKILLDFHPYLLLTILSLWLVSLGLRIFKRF